MRLRLCWSLAIFGQGASLINNVIHEFFGQSPSKDTIH